jgi:murein DD-endopeptidase MepM/ murein hydrolase activator NlpD
MAQMFWPFDPSLINYGFGNAPGYGGFHNGIDFAVGQGTELRATASGTIRNNDAGQVDGAGVDITTPDGWKVRMWHVSAFLVPNGSWVEAGQVVALSGGARGTWGAGNATGPHLHWGVMIGGSWVDPASLNPIPFGSQPAPEPQPAGTQVTIQPGMTLWGLAEQYYGDGSRYMDIFNASSFRSGNPNLIFPGEIAVIP